MLLEAGATVEYGAAAGATALQIVSASNRDIKTYTNDAESVRWAGYAASDRRIEVARILIDAGLEPDSRYGNKASAIERADFAGDTELATFLRSQVE